MTYVLELPSGAIDPGETPAEAARPASSLEETGCQCGPRWFRSAGSTSTRGGSRRSSGRSTRPGLGSWTQTQAEKKTSRCSSFYPTSSERRHRERGIQPLGSRRDDRPRHAVRTARAVRVLVTGGRGFIGARLVNALVDRGDKVRILDNGSRGEAAVLRTRSRRSRRTFGMATPSATRVRGMDVVGAPRRRAGHGQLLLDAGGGARRQPPRRPEHCRRMCGCGGPTPGLLVVVGSVRASQRVPDPRDPRRWSSPIRPTHGGRMEEARSRASWSS